MNHLPSQDYVGAAAEQVVVLHSDDAAVSPELQQKIDDGLAFCIMGEALGLAKHVAAHFVGEVLWCFAAQRTNPFVTRYVFVPKEQSGSGAHCQATGKALLAVARQADNFEGGCQVTCMSHSHAGFGVFSSGIDLATMIQLADDGVGWPSIKWSEVAGTIAATERQMGEQERECPSTQEYTISFPDHPWVRVTFSSTRQFSTEEIDVALHIAQRQLVSVFSTFNSRGDHHCPTLKRIFCPSCGKHEDEIIPASDVEIHVFGDEQLDAEQEEAISLQCEEVRMHHGWPSVAVGWENSVPSDAYGVSPAALPEPSMATISSTTHVKKSTNVSLESYQVWRRGELIGEIPAWLMEKTGAIVPEVAQALGWRSGNENESPDVKETTQGESDGGPS